MSPLAATSGVTVAVGSSTTVGGGGDGGNTLYPCRNRTTCHKGSDSVFSTITGQAVVADWVTHGCIQAPEPSRISRMNGGSGGRVLVVH